MKAPNFIVFNKSTYLTDNVSDKHVQRSATLADQSKPTINSSSRHIDNKASQPSVVYSVNSQSTQTASGANNYSVKSVTDSPHDKSKLFGTVDRSHFLPISWLQNSKAINLKNVMSVAFFMSGMLLMFYIVHFI